MDRVVAAVAGRRSPTGEPGSSGAGGRARCCGPCGWSRRSGGPAAGRATSKPSSASCGTCVLDALEAAPGAREQLVPGAEAGAHAVDLERAALGQRRRRGGLGALDRGGELGPSAASCWRLGRVVGSVRSACSISGASAPCALGAASSSTRPRTARPRGRAGRRRPCAASSSRQEAKRSIQASIVVLPAPERRPGSGPPSGRRRGARRSAHAAPRATAVARRRGSGRRRAARSWPSRKIVGARPSTASPTQRLARVAAAVDSGRGRSDADAAAGGSVALERRASLAVSLSVARTVQP